MKKLVLCFILALTFVFGALCPQTANAAENVNYNDYATYNWLEKFVTANPSRTTGTQGEATAAVWIEQQLQQMGVRTVLHGHKHLDLERPLITDSYYENPNNIIDIIAGGSVGTSRVPKHTFNIIELFFFFFFFFLNFT